MNSTQDFQFYSFHKNKKIIKFPFFEETIKIFYLIILIIHLQKLFNFYHYLRGKIDV